MGRKYSISTINVGCMPNFMTALHIHFITWKHRINTELLVWISLMHLSQEFSLSFDNRLTHNNDNPNSQSWQRSRKWYTCKCLLGVLENSGNLTFSINIPLKRLIWPTYKAFVPHNRQYSQKNCETNFFTPDQIEEKLSSNICWVGIRQCRVATFFDFYLPWLFPDLREISLTFDKVFW